MQKESLQAASMGSTSFCLPYAEHFLPNLTRDFRELLRIHAAGLRHVVDNEDGLDIKNRAYHLSAELYLLQHSCRSEEHTSELQSLMRISYDVFCLNKKNKHSY